MRTVVHLSDLHFGRTDATVVAAVTSLCTQLAPDLVVVSGDLTQRARPDQFRQARQFLDSLPQPQIVVPGNHDVPLYNLFQRFLQPLTKYKRFVTCDLEPFYTDDEIAVAGINTARSLTWKDGRINEEQMQKLHERMAPQGEGKMKVVVTHHPFDLPGGHDGDDLVGRAKKAMAVFREAGADILLAGHLHVTHTGHTANRFPMDGYSALVIQAGTATSTRHRGETNSFNVIRIDGDRVQVERQAWQPGDGRFDVASTEGFVRLEGGWRAAVS